MMMDVILVIVGVIGTLVAALSDIKTREVPDWVSYGMIVSGLGLRAMYALATTEWMYIVWGMIGFAGTAAVGYGMYLLRQWGGGDAKLLMGLGAIFATRPSFVGGDIPFLVVVFVNVLVCGAAYGIIMGGVLAIRQGKSWVKRFMEMNQEKTWKITKMMTMGIVVGAAIILWSVSRSIFMSPVIYWMLLVILLYPYIIIATRVIEQVCMMKRVKVAELREGDWVEEDVMKDGKVIVSKKRLGIEKKDIEKLMKAKINAVLVKEGIPFVPPFLLGVIISVISGKIVFLL